MELPSHGYIADGRYHQRPAACGTPIRMPPKGREETTELQRAELSFRPIVLKNSLESVLRSLLGTLPLNRWAIMQYRPI